jgi:large subunit ribosomal protein L15
MQLHDLSPAPGSRKNRKRVGRGRASGQGTTAGRGNNGQASRAGGTKGPGFEGGQMPLQRRIPKLPGFKNRFRKEYVPINVGRLEAAFATGDVVDVAALVEKGFVKSIKVPVKVLGDGELTKALTVKVDKVSAGAAEKIAAAGGKVE